MNEGVIDTKGRRLEDITLRQQLDANLLVLGYEKRA